MFRSPKNPNYCIWAAGALVSKKNPAFACGVFMASLSRRLRRDLDARSLRALRARGDFEFYALAFLQAAKALGVDRRKVDEHVLPTVLRRDETETLGVVEPLDRTETHAETSGHGIEARPCDGQGFPMDPLGLPPRRRRSIDMFA